MTKVHSKALGETIHVNRIIGRVDGKTPGPCLIFFGGIHGNEPASVFALHQVVQELGHKQKDLSGSFIAISGNLWALERSVRYHKADLNRLWSAHRMEALKKEGVSPKNEDEKQQLEIFELLQGILDTETGPFYFFDLHTTSSETVPFITVNDSLINRKFTSQYPVPLILGIEEYLDGPLLSYINELGYVSFGFEAGQHDELVSITNHKIFIYLSLVFSNALNQKAIEYDQYLSIWNSIMPKHPAFYEIYNRFNVNENEHFVMKPGFSNFQSIDRNENLATINGNAIYSKEKSIIFMPLYQNQGSDGYFLIRKIPKFFLWLSSILRKYMIDRVFVLFPGVKWDSKLRDTMVVDLRIARFISKKLFHLFGYRSKQIDQHHLLIKNREYRSKKQDYCQEKWF
ncbi:succinylglutamate desuccinylase/aspartoacylase family protein [Kriegella aquimaris]|uniref:Succinylglutamate desuccinylase / Aspartoacylase family protein n=1 Tax=Kriegella aquimaris TaxID=192904 RepID=A0A1G9SX00_9FLAO|nr:succinylglutamate desuccinylase/aspartoacylase family protein [Kriegella aquimaris]SDM39942.1 Succinylglutamate desuccinylase / Aspartoacylase family protein [Kriegella aquimaris]